MEQWVKRVQSAAGNILQLIVKYANATIRWVGGRIVPIAMSGAAKGLSSAARLLNKGASRLRKNTKNFSALDGRRPSRVPMASFISRRTRGGGARMGPR